MPSSYSAIEFIAVKTLSPCNVPQALPGEWDRAAAAPGPPPPPAAVAWPGPAPTGGVLQVETLWLRLSSSLHSARLCGGFTYPPPGVPQRAKGWHPLGAATEYSTLGRGRPF